MPYSSLQPRYHCFNDLVWFTHQSLTAPRISLPSAPKSCSFHTALRKPDYLLRGVLLKASYSFTKKTCPHRFPAGQARECLHGGLIRIPCQIVPWLINRFNDEKSSSLGICKKKNPRADVVVALRFIDTERDKALMQANLINVPMIWYSTLFIFCVNPKPAYNNW